MTETNQVNQEVYEFGRFRLEVAKRLLLREGQPVALAPKAFDVLLVLVQYHGEVLDKDRLMQMLWPDSFVEEANLPQNISALRKALGESPTQRKYIVTVPGRGYKFAAEVKTLETNTAEMVLARYTKSTLIIQNPEESQESVPKPKELLPAFEPNSNRKKLIFFSLVVATLGLGAMAFYLIGSANRPANNEFHAIAILPFASASADPNSEYLGDGIAESLINSLSQLSNLKVIARTTAFRYKGKEADAQSIGQDLRVDALITGRVIQQGDTLIVQVDLLNTTDGSQIWGARYSRKLSDVFAVQEQIAKEIAGNLQFKLTGEEKLILSKRYTENLKAYQNYLLGWNYLQRRTGQDFFTAINYFEKAIAEEPNYALPYAALTEAYVSITIRGLIDPVVGRRKAEESARKALVLDPKLAESQVATGQIQVIFAPFNFSGGDQELLQAIESSPSLTEGHRILGVSRMEQGRLDEALKAWQKARELDPLSPIVARLEAFTYLLQRDYSRSLELLRQSKELGSPFIIASEVEIYIQSHQLDEALVELEKAKLERKDDPLLIFSTGMVAAAQGKRTAALQVIRQLEELSGASLHRAMWIAMVYAALNEKELALSWLERGLQAGAIIIFYKTEPVWDAVRGDPRFDDLLKQMGIPG